MSKQFLPSWFQKLLATIILVASLSSWAIGDDRFAVAVGEHNSLLIFGPNGERVAEIVTPTISQQVTIGATSFQVSYGRDVNNLLTGDFGAQFQRPAGPSLHCLE